MDTSKVKYKDLHTAIDLAVVEFVTDTGQSISKVPIFNLIEWLYVRCCEEQDERNSRDTEH